MHGRWSTQFGFSVSRRPSQIVKLFLICSLKKQREFKAESPNEAMFLVRHAFAPTPVPKRKISTYHSAKMRKMCDALVSPENSTEQFKKRVQDYEHDRWHWDWRNQQDNAAAWKKHAERQQNSKDRAGRATGR